MVVWDLTDGVLLLIVLTGWSIFMFWMQTLLFGVCLGILVLLLGVALFDSGVINGAG